MRGKGDKGSTELFGGLRVMKDELRVECYGEIDELSSLIGVVIASLDEDDIDLKEVLINVQEKLFRAASELATPSNMECPVPKINGHDITQIEQLISRYESALQPLRHFIYPGGSRVGSLLHLVRAVTRRTERRLVSLNRREALNESLIPFFNRLSTLFFILAREVNRRKGVSELQWGGRGIY
ncbi:MAG: cob(I)yrinic acid a,c-diamide adenosyltransferase [Aigarchaeota archaeon]|nr:cob(I)yrinic acid a,c-diamide adenosyltransferase [Aigarchaeota archaeon]MDW8092833.1 cob(I)yrinic acid a,c-diamide adenosyltransferase [Nitrososphaerota archaeon]